MAWADLAENKFLLALFTAVCGFFFALIVERMKSRNSLRKQLSWEIRVDERFLQVREGRNAERIAVSYGNVPVQNLVQILASFENTGNSVIKNQYLRFRFPEESRILEMVPEPEPEPELGVVEVDGGNLSALERRYLIAHLEVGQSIRYRIVADGGRWLSWSDVHPFNQEGGVEFQRRDAARARDDEEEVVPFIRAGAMLIALLSATVVAPPVLDVLAAAATLLLAGYLSSKAPAISRVVSRFLVGRPTSNIQVQNAEAVQIGSGVAHVNDYCKEPHSL